MSTAGKPTAKEGQEGGTTKLLRMLVLHGKGGDGEGFQGKMSTYEDILLEKHNTRLQVVPVDAPFPRPDEDGGFASWTLPPGVRSFNASEYLGFERSCSLVLETIRAEGPFDLIYGHSQGAILVTAMLAQKRFPHFPSKGFLLNGVAWPNPFTEELQTLQFEKKSPPKILIITGKGDRINPPETQAKVREALKKAGASVDYIRHTSGHHIVYTAMRDCALYVIVDWMASGCLPEGSNEFII